MALIIEAISHKQYYKILDIIKGIEILLSLINLYYIYILTFTVIKKYSNNYKIINWC